MSQHSHENPDQWDYMAPRSYGPREQRSYRSETLVPTETAAEYADRVVSAVGGRQCRVCGELTVGTVLGDPLCAGCEDEMAAES